MNIIMTYEQWVETTCEYNWWEWCYETFTAEMMDNYSVRVDDISFEGFYSQDDGAVFTGNVTDIPKFLEATQIVLDHLAYNELARNDASSTSIMFKRFSHRGYTVFADVERCDSISTYVDMPLINEGIFAGRVWSEVCALVDFNELETQLTDWAKDRCNELFDMLEEEYESLTSEEAYEKWVKENYEGETK